MKDNRSHNTIFHTVSVPKVKFIIPVFLASIALFSSCNTLEKTSLHGFNSGYYKVETDTQSEAVYVNVTEEKVDIYNQNNKTIDKSKYRSISLNQHEDSLHTIDLNFRKQSLDIDITSILLKYRPSVLGLPPQLTSDINLAMYAGWRHDKYKLKSKKDRLGNQYNTISSLGYDLGVFAGPGTTTINAFTTNNKSQNEYSGMIIQTGIAGFIESNIASFGFAVGIDHLTNRDRDIWIYSNKPWIGFIVGIAIN